MQNGLLVNFLFILHCLFIQIIPADHNENTSRIYDIYGRFVGLTRLVPSPQKVEARALKQMVITADDGKQMNIAAGVYFVTPSNFSDPMLAGGNVGEFAFRNVTADVLPSEQWKASDVEIADLNGDGKEDIVFSISTPYCLENIDTRPRVWVQTTTGNFVDETELRIPQGLNPSQDIEVLDCDVDGDIDLFLTGYGCGSPFPTASLLINDGSGVFTDESNTRLPEIPIDAFVLRAEAERIDSDQSDDLVVVLFGVGVLNPITNQFSRPEIWLNTGDGYFIRDTSGRLSDLGKYGFFELYTADLNKDTLSDLIFASLFTYITINDPSPIDSLSGAIAFYRNIGNGFFVDETPRRMPEGFYRTARCLALSDVDSDSDLDILEVGILKDFHPANNPQVRLLLNDGTGHFSVSSTSNLDSLVGWFNDSKFALLNEDSYPDLFLTKVYPGTPDYDVLLINNGEGSFLDSSSLLPNVLDFSVACVLFDHQRDADIDIFIANTGGIADSSGQNVLYQNLLNDVTSTIDRDNLPPASFMLFQNYPNPFNPATTISFSLPHSAHAQLTILNINGQIIGTLVNNNLHSGNHSFIWNASNLPSGIYLIQLSINHHLFKTLKSLLIR